jgi:hypothetical protein
MIDEEKKEEKKREKGKAEECLFKGLGRLWTLVCYRLRASKQTNKLGKKKGRARAGTSTCNFFTTAQTAWMDQLTKILLAYILLQTMLLQY